MEAIRRTAARTRPLDSRWGWGGTAALDMSSEGPSLDAIDVPPLPTATRPTRPTGLRRVAVPGGTRLEAEPNGTWTALSQAITIFEAGPTPPGQPAGPGGAMPAPVPGQPRQPLRPAVRRGPPGRPGAWALDPDAVPVAAEADVPSAHELEQAAIAGELAMYGPSRIAGMSGAQRMRAISYMRVALRRLFERKSYLVGERARVREKHEGLKLSLLGQREALAGAISRGFPPGVIARMRAALHDMEALTSNTGRDFDVLGQQLATTDTALTDLTALLAYWGFGA